MDSIATAVKKRDYARERKLALERTVERVAELREDRNSGALGDEVIKMAQALILCTLPYRPTAERQVVRTARLSDGSTLRVTFTAGINGVDMPYGNDRHLMAWLFDKAINSDTAFVTIKSASDYLRETGKARNGDRVKELAGRLSRLAGLVIGIERRAEDATQTVMLPMIASSNLPHNLTVQLDKEESGQERIPGLEDPFGIQLEERFFQDIKRHHVAIPRRLWMQLQGQKGGPQLQDFLIFFVYRCYCAQRETVIPWSGLREQFPQDDSNPRRFKQNVKKAIQQLRVLWPEVRIDVLKEGVWINRATQQLLPEDPSRKRVRRIEASN
jgi:Plasmid encoded RepA protein